MNVFSLYEEDKVIEMILYIKWFKFLISTMFSSSLGGTSLPIADTAESWSRDRAVDVVVLRLHRRKPRLPQHGQRGLVVQPDQVMFR